MGIHPHCMVYFTHIWHKINFIWGSLLATYTIVYRYRWYRRRCTPTSTFTSARTLIFTPTFASPFKPSLTSTYIRILISISTPTLASTWRSIFTLIDVQSWWQQRVYLSIILTDHVILSPFIVTLTLLVAQAWVGTYFIIRCAKKGIGVYNVCLVNSHRIYQHREMSFMLSTTVLRIKYLQAVVMYLCYWWLRCLGCGTWVHTNMRREEKLNSFSSHSSLWSTSLQTHQHFFMYLFLKIHILQIKHFFISINWLSESWTSLLNPPDCVIISCWL